MEEEGSGVFSHSRNLNRDQQEQANDKRHKTSIDWVMQMISQARHWLLEGKLVLVVDGGLIALKLGLDYFSQKQPIINPIGCSLARPSLASCPSLMQWQIW